MARPDRLIAVFDSGLGGISVLRELIRQMPCEQFLYFGDSANAPYGSRPTAEVRAAVLRRAEDVLGAQIAGDLIEGLGLNNECDEEG